MRRVRQDHTKTNRMTFLGPSCLPPPQFLHHIRSSIQREVLSTRKLDITSLLNYIIRIDMVMVMAIWPQAPFLVQSRWSVTV